MAQFNRQTRRKFNRATQQKQQQQNSSFHCKIEFPLSWLVLSRVDIEQTANIKRQVKLGNLPYGGAC